VRFIDTDLVTRTASASELQAVEAVTRGLTRLVRAHPDLERCWEDNPPVSAHDSVMTGSGPVRVSLVAPHPEAD